ELGLLHLVRPDSWPPADLFPLTGVHDHKVVLSAGTLVSSKTRPISTLDYEPNRLPGNYRLESRFPTRIASRK
ncbi:MAG: hypothetical protein VX734_10000, partial [Actinomycetota bacterium]|nr:hypothetical protein [Actinomycetota bacterium]